MPIEKKTYTKYLRIASIVSLVALFFTWIFFYAVTGVPTTIFWIVLALATIITISLIICDRVAILSFLKMRFVRKAFIGIFSLIVVMGILVALYVISSNFPLRFDLTRNKSYTVSKQTTDVLSRITEQLSIVVLRTQSTDPTSADWKADLLLKQYSRLNKNVKLEYINPIEKPSARSVYNMTQVGEIIFTYSKGKQVRVYRNDLMSQGGGRETIFVGEEKFTQSIYTLLESESLVIYFTSGHGERQIADRGGEGLSSVKTYLENENYQVRNLNIALENIPTDASLIIIAGPVETFAQFELDKLTKYVRNGGKLFVLYDSFMDRQNFNSNLGDFLLDFGFVTVDDYIIDPISSVIIPVNVVPQYTTHPITQTLKEGNIFAALIVARSIRTAQNPKYKGTFENIITTTPQGYGKKEATFDLQRARFNPRTDTPGPVPLAIVGTYPIEGIEDQSKYGRIILFGDATFSLNAYINPGQGNSVDVAFAGNKDLFMNSVSYLLDAREKITIRPKEASIKNLTLTTTQTNFIRYVAQIGLPCLFGIFGILIWFLRKK